IEPVTGVAWWEGEHVYGYDQGQNPHAQNRTYASQLGVNQSRCHIRQTSGVGGLGGGGQTCEPSLCALLSKKAGVPVAISRTRRLHSIRRRNHYSPKGITKLGGKRDGTMTAMQQKWYCHGGFNAAAGNGWENIDCSYILPNVTQETYGVATNTGFGAGHRCLMHPEAAFTLCVALNAMADAIGMTPLEYLRKVTITDDMLNQDNGRPMTCASTRMCLEAVNEKINYEQKYHAPGTRTLPDGRLHGVGIACFNDRHGHSGAGRGVVIYMNTDGTCNFVTGQSNNQNGTNSVTQANIIAEALGLPFEAVYCSSYGTNDQAPDGGMQAGSQGASSNGSASLMAALDIREQLFAHAANQLGVAVDDLHARDGKIFVKTDQSKSLTHAEVMARISKPIIGVGKSFAEVLRRPFQGKPIGTPAFHRQGVASAFEVAVDPDTGDVEILAHAHTTDCGRVIDPVTAGGQIGSSLWTACGKGLLWDVHHDPQRGALLDQTHIDMKAHTAMDINDDVHGGWLTESVNATGPFGMSGLGEPAANGSGFAALLMAIHNAIGGDFSKFTRPMSPDRILKHLGKA
ncbi:MAG: molybdopterin-dependent oxidoreductase, partial [Dehalococcoidales bacterium]|nr:molybdopterin-dependent oxidoreductase [Dehalococcoidales bacterium]